MFFITGDVVKYNMTLNLSTEAGTVAVGIYFYDESLAYVGTAYASHTISAADTDTAISGSLTIPSNLSSAKYFLVGVGDSRSTKYQIYAKKVSFKLYNGGVVRSGRFWGRELVIYKETSYTDQLNDFGVRIGNPSYINLKMGDCYIQSCFRDSDARPLYLNYKGGNVYVGGEDSDVMVGNTTGSVGQASGNLYTGKLHVTDTTTATLTDHALMVGSPSGSHVNIGGYKIQGSNGSSGLLVLNPGGGSIYAGAAGATVYIGTGSGKLHTGDLLNSSGTSVMPDIATATKTAAVSTSTTAKVTKIGANGFFFCSCIGTVSAGAWTTLYTLPVGYRPGATVYGLCNINGGSDSYGGNCLINSSGQVQVYLSSGASGKYISIFVSW